jgi:hypothetical protein
MQLYLKDTRRHSTFRAKAHVFACYYIQGRRNRSGSRPRCPLPGGARGAKVPFQFKGLPWRNSELSEMLVQFFYEFASENARNAVIELQE